MTISQEQYDAYVRAEDAWYKRIFTRDSPLDSYENVGFAWPNDSQAASLKEIYRQLSTLGPNSTPIDRLNVRQTIDSSISTAAMLALFNSEPFRINLDPTLLSILDSIKTVSTGTSIFVPPAGSPPNFYQFYAQQNINPTPDPSPSNPSPPLSSGPTSGSEAPSTSTSPTASQPTSPVPNCYEKNGVVMTIGSESFHLKLLPAIQSNIPMQGSSEAPNTAPGLHIKIIPNLARLRIPGFAPVYQHLGIDSALVTLVGTFVPEDGEDPQSFTNVTGFAPPANINDQTAFNQVRNSELERSSYAAATKFYDFAIKTGGEVSVYINVPEAVGVENNPFVLDRKPGFKGIIKSMDLFHKNLYRTWYTIQFEVSDFGMYSSTPLDMNQDINEAIQEQVGTETQDPGEETQSTLDERIGNRNLISYNDADNEGYFRSGDSYYFRFANPQSCRRTLLSAATILRCDDEQWVEISDINEDQARQFAETRSLPEGARINYPSYETVRDIRRNGYQQFSSDGALIRQVDGSDITGAELASLAVQTGGCILAIPAAGITSGASLGTLTPLAAAGVGVACGSLVASSVSTGLEFGGAIPDFGGNEGAFEGVVLPLTLEAGAWGLARLGRNFTRLRRPSTTGNLQTATLSTPDPSVVPPGTSSSASNALPLDPPDPLPAPPSPPASSAPNPVQPTSPPPPASSAANPPTSTPRPVTTPPDPTPPGSNGPPSNFTPPTSPVVSAVTKSISANDVYVSRGDISAKIPLSQYFSEENIDSVQLRGGGFGYQGTVRIDSSGNLVGDKPAVNYLINTLAQEGSLFLVGGKMM